VVFTCGTVLFVAARIAVTRWQPDTLRDVLVVSSLDLCEARIPLCGLRSAPRPGHGRLLQWPDIGAAGGGSLSIMTAGPCVRLAKITSVSEKTRSAVLLGGPRRRLTDLLLPNGTTLATICDRDRIP
jgi:hypothetical protein